MICEVFCAVLCEVSYEVFCEVSCEVFCDDIDEDDGVGVGDGEDGGLETRLETPINGWAFTAFLGRNLESQKVLCDEAPEDVNADEGVREVDDGGWEEMV